MKASHAELRNQARAATLEETTILRRLLWLYHGHSNLYGDDGEMQCGECGLDYKRDDIETIEKYFNEMEMKRMLDFSVALGDNT